MAERINFRGQSGTAYSFFRLEEQAALRPIGVTYVIAQPGPEGWRLLRVGHSNNLAERTWAPILAGVRQEHPAAELLIRLNISRAIREAEAADLVPMTE